METEEFLSKLRELYRERNWVLDDVYKYYDRKIVILTHEFEKSQPNNENKEDEDA